MVWWFTSRTVSNSLALTSFFIPDIDKSIGLSRESKLSYISSGGRWWGGGGLIFRHKASRSFVPLGNHIPSVKTYNMRHLISSIHLLGLQTLRSQQGAVVTVRWR